MLPAYLQHEFDKLSGAEKMAFYQIIQWGSTTGLAGIILPVSDTAYENAFKMVKQMGLVEEVKENKEVEE